MRNNKCYYELTNPQGQRQSFFNCRCDEERNGYYTFTFDDGMRFTVSYWEGWRVTLKFFD